MEKVKSHIRVSGHRSSIGDSTIRPSTSSSTLAIHSQTEQQASSLCESPRPTTSPTSSQSTTQPEWDPAGHSYYGSKANTSSEIDDLNLEPDEFWPQPDSEDDSEEDRRVSSTLKRSATPTPGSTARKIRAILHKFDRSYNKRYDFLPNDAQEKDRNILQHNILLEMLDGKLHLAPVVNARRVLDLGCGPGIWPLEFARRNPKTGRSSLSGLSRYSPLIIRLPRLLSTSG
ncbi:hypothetical protein F4801DRAFT_230287 [Xylaria longipes]|nr:hypothetical protein F4801DRAFT_230287 [Xylaria longipes]